MKVKRVPIDSLSPDPANARKHPDRNIEQIVASLRRFGQQKPIVVDRSNVVRAGNGTLEAAKRLGWTEIAVVVSELPVSELTAYAVVDNRTAELAEWDRDILAGVLSDPDIGDLGFSEMEIAALQEPIDELKDGFDDNKDPNHEPADVAFAIGEFRFIVQREEYLGWVHRLKDQCGVDEGEIEAELKRRLKL